METIEEFEINGHTVRIHPDNDGDGSGNTRDADNVGIMLAEGHRRYELGDAKFRDAEGEYNTASGELESLAEDGRISDFPAWAKEHLGASVVKPLWLLDHSGLTMRTAPFAEDPGNWDSGIVGFIFDTAKTRERLGVVDTDDIERILDDEVKYYSMYLEGDVCGYTIEDPAGREVDSCWGFLGSDAAKEAATEAAGTLDLPQWLAVVIGKRGGVEAVHGPYASQDEAAEDGVAVVLDSVRSRQYRLIAPQSYIDDMRATYPGAVIAWSPGVPLSVELTRAQLKEKLDAGFVIAD